MNAIFVGGPWDRRRMTIPTGWWESPIRVVQPNPNVNFHSILVSEPTKDDSIMHVYRPSIIDDELQLRVHESLESTEAVRQVALAYAT